MWRSLDNPVYATRFQLANNYTLIGTFDCSVLWSKGTCFISTTPWLHICTYAKPSDCMVKCGQIKAPNFPSYCPYNKFTSSYNYGFSCKWR